VKQLRKVQNEKGITLVELLAAIAIVSVIAGMIVSIVISSMNNANSIEKSNDLRTQANSILFQLTNLHQNSREYTIKYEDSNKFSILSINSNGINKSSVIDLNDYEYELYVNDEKLTASNDITINLRDSNYLTAKIKLKLVGTGKGRDDEVTIHSSISRMTPATGGG
jgi:type II secretory pathway pseudopilin PulG